MQVVRVKDLKNGKPVGKSYRVYKVGDFYYEYSPTGLIDDLRVMNVIEDYPRMQPLKRTKKKTPRKDNDPKAKRRMIAHKQQMVIIKKGRAFNYSGKDLKDPVKEKKHERALKTYKKLESEVAELAKRFQV